MFRTRFLLIGADLLVIGASILAAHHVRLPESDETVGGLPFILRHHTGASAIFALSNLLFLYVFDNYNQKRPWASPGTYWTVLAATGLGSLFSAAAFYLNRDWSFGRGLFALQWAFMTMGACIARIVVHRLQRHLPPQGKLLILGTGPSARAIVDECAVPGQGDYAVAGLLHVGIEPAATTLWNIPVHRLEGDLAESLIRLRADTLVIAEEASTAVDPNLIRELVMSRNVGVRVLNARQFYKAWTGKLLIPRVGGDWSLTVKPFDIPARPFLGNAHRLFDVLAAGACLALAVPALPFIAVLIKLDSAGPVFFRQTRVGLNRRLFTIIKLRTMRENAEPEGALWARAGNDARVTRFGRLLRRTRLDELPQLWNVLKGEMSLIGPRPERPEFIERLEREIPFYDLRLTVRPGMTGWAQVNCGYAASIEETVVKLQYDLYYIQENSLALNMRILLRTLQTLVLRQGS